MNILRGISKQKPEVKAVIVDTINTIMNDKEMEEMGRSGYDKWKDMAVEIYELYRKSAEELRSDLVVFFMAHIEPYEADGETHWRTKTSGQKLTKLNLNSKLAYNLYTHVEREGNTPTYYFITQTSGRNEARSVENVLPLKLENDLGLVLESIRKYDLGIENADKNSK